jgi:hypothetical protein
MKLQHLKNKILCTIGKFTRSTLIRDMHISFKIAYLYDYITKLCRQQAQVIQYRENIHVRNIGQGKALHRKYKRLKLGGGMTIQVIKLYQAWTKRGVVYVLYILYRHIMQ